MQNRFLFLDSGDDNSVWLINQAYQIHPMLFKISFLDIKECLWMLLKEQSLECPENDAEILLNGKLVIRFQESKILMAFSQLLKIYEILVGLPMPCMCPTLCLCLFLSLIFFLSLSLPSLSLPFSFFLFLLCLCLFSFFLFMYHSLSLLTD